MARTGPRSEKSVPRLPENSIREILLRLPVKSLVRFRTVERAWENLILEDGFVKDHLTYNSTQKRADYNCIVVNKDQELSILSHDQETIVCPSEDFQLVGSIRGLVCLRHDKKFSLWNPALRKSVEFSLPPNLANDLKNLNLDFDDLNNVGLCFDRQYSDFKVIVCYKRFESTHGILYSFEDNAWLDSVALDNLFAKDSSTAPTVVINDCPYWTKHSSDNQFILLSVIKFDADVDKFKPLPQFRTYRIHGGARYQFVNMNDSLTVLAYENKKRACPVVDVYCLDKEVESGIWNPIYKVGPLNFQDRYMWSLSQGFRFGNELVFREPGGYFFYDLESEKMRFLRGSSSDYVINCYPYTPALTWLTGMNSVDSETANRAIGDCSRPPSRLIESLGSK